jgi:hypothetical protein
MRKIFVLTLLSCLPFLHMASVAARLERASLKQHAVQNSRAVVTNTAPELQPDLLRHFIQ